MKIERPYATFRVRKVLFSLSLTICEIIIFELSDVQLDCEKDQGHADLNESWLAGKFTLSTCIRLSKLALLGLAVCTRAFCEEHKYIHRYTQAHSINIIQFC